MKHAWIKIEITPVEVLATEGEPAVFVDPDQQGEAADMAQVGCASCDVMLDEETINTDCPGEDALCEGVVKEVLGDPFDRNRRHWDVN